VYVNCLVIGNTGNQPGHREYGISGISLTSPVIGNTGIKLTSLVIGNDGISLPRLVIGNIGRQPCVVMYSF